MKKALLFITLAFAATTVVSAQTQKEWTFEKAPFEVTSYVQNTTLDGLTIIAASGKNVDIDANNKRNGDFAFTHRLKMGGAATIDAVTAPWLPTQRAVSFEVSGSGAISVASLSSSSTSNRKLILSNGTDSLYHFSSPGTYSDGTNTVPMETYQYTGGAATLYLWSPSSGVNIYYIAGPSGQTAVKKIQIAGVSYNGSVIMNENNTRIELYNILGNKVAETTSNLSMETFGRGIYFVKAAGSKEVLKINR